VDRLRWLLVAGVVVSAAVWAGLPGWVERQFEDVFPVVGALGTWLRIQALAVGTCLIAALLLPSDRRARRSVAPWARGAALVAAGSGLALLLVAVALSWNAWPIHGPDPGWRWYPTIPGQGAAESLRQVARGGLAVIVGLVGAAGILSFRRLGELRGAR
jgi:hypothetical protein